MSKIVWLQNFLKQITYDWLLIYSVDSKLGRGNDKKQVKKLLLSCTLILNSSSKNSNKTISRWHSSLENILSDETLAENEGHRERLPLLRAGKTWLNRTHETDRGQQAIWLTITVWKQSVRELLSVQNLLIYSILLKHAQILVKLLNRTVRVLREFTRIKTQNVI